MSFFRSIGSAIRNFANFRGRANRREFWYWLAFVVIIYLAAVYFDIAYLAALRGYPAFSDEAGTPVAYAWLIICIIPTLSLIVRRVHDHDKSGWWALTIVPLVWWLVAKGTRGPNRYG